MALDVNGAIVSAPAASPGSIVIHFSSGNLKYSALNCQAFTLNNMKDGASYVLVVQGATSANPTALLLSQTSNRKNFTVSLTAGSGNGTPSPAPIYNYKFRSRFQSEICHQRVINLSSYFEICRNCMKYRRQFSFWFCVLLSA